MQGLPVMMPELYVDHLVFRVRDLSLTERFYQRLFGPPASQSVYSLMYLIGETRLFLTAAPPDSMGPYDKEQPGLNHLAFGVREPALLRVIRDQLNVAEVHHSGIQIDSYGKKEYIWLDDPDGFRLEFYCRPAM